VRAIDFGNEKGKEMVKFFDPWVRHVTHPDIRVGVLRTVLWLAPQP